MFVALNILCLLNNSTIMAKKKKGRPKGDKKEPVNIYMECGRAERLRDLAVTEQKTISIMVENSLEKTYGI